MTKRGIFRGRPRQISVFIPSRYVLRPSKANRMIWILLSPLAAFLLVVCFQGFWVSAQIFLPLVQFYGGGLLLFYLACILAAFLAAAVLLACPLLAVKSRKDFLTVDGEQLVFQRWLRKPLAFAFSDIAFVRARRGRETVLLQDRQGQVLCRLPVTMEHMDILQADLRSRRIPFAERDGPVMNASALSPGPRREEITLTLPAEVPGFYQLRYPFFFTAVFAVLLFGSLGCALAAWLEQQDPAAFCFLPFALMAVVGLVWVRMERVEVIDGRIHRRNPRGQITEVPFDRVAAVRVSTAATGIGPMSSAQLLAEDGGILLEPVMWLPDAHLLLADLIDRGIPFTY